MLKFRNKKENRPTVKSVANRAKNIALGSLAIGLPVKTVGSYGLAGIGGSIKKAKQNQTINKYGIPPKYFGKAGFRTGVRNKFISDRNRAKKIVSTVKEYAPTVLRSAKQGLKRGVVGLGIGTAGLGVLKLAKNRKNKK